MGKCQPAMIPEVKKPLPFHIVLQKFVQTLNVTPQEQPGEVIFV